MQSDADGRRKRQSEGAQQSELKYCTVALLDEAFLLSVHRRYCDGTHVRGIGTQAHTPGSPSGRSLGSVSYPERKTVLLVLVFVVTRVTAKNLLSRQLIKGTLYSR